MRILLVGMGLTALVTAALVAALGQPAALPGLVMGAMATMIQLAAVRWLRRGWGGTNPEFLKAVGAGMGLRLLGVAVMAVLIAVDRGRFPPLPAAAGFLGVLIPLLFLEVRFVR